MVNPARELVARRILELKKTGLTLSKASKMLGRNAAYLQQFVSRGVPLELEEDDRLRLGQILQVNSDELKGPGKRHLRVFTPGRWSKNHEKRDMPIEIAEPISADLDQQKLQHWIPSHLIEFFLRQIQSGADQGVRIYYAANLEGMSAAIKIAKHARSALPAQLTRQLSDAGYGLLIPNDVMEPELRRGAIALVDPELAPRPGTTCVLRKRDNESEAVVRRVERITETDYQAYAHQGRIAKSRLKLEIFPIAQWHAHVIIGNLFPPSF